MDSIAAKREAVGRRRERSESIHIRDVETVGKKDSLEAQLEAENELLMDVHVEEGNDVRALLTKAGPSMEEMGRMSNLEIRQAENAVLRAGFAASLSQKDINEKMAAIKSRRLMVGMADPKSQLSDLLKNIKTKESILSEKRAERNAWRSARRKEYELKMKKERAVLEAERAKRLAQKPTGSFTAQQGVRMRHARSPSLSGSRSPNGLAKDGVASSSSPTLSRSAKEAARQEEMRRRREAALEASRMKRGGFVSSSSPSLAGPRKKGGKKSRAGAEAEARARKEAAREAKRAERERARAAREAKARDAADARRAAARARADAARARSSRSSRNSPSGDSLAGSRSSSRGGGFGFGSSGSLTQSQLDRITRLLGVDHGEGSLDALLDLAEGMAERKSALEKALEKAQRLASRLGPDGKCRTCGSLAKQVEGLEAEKARLALAPAMWKSKYEAVVAELEATSSLEDKLAVDRLRRKAGRLTTLLSEATERASHLEGLVALASGQGFKPWVDVLEFESLHLDSLSYLLLRRLESNTVTIRELCAELEGSEQELALVYSQRDGLRNSIHAVRTQLDATRAESASQIASLASALDEHRARAHTSVADDAAARIRILEQEVSNVQALLVAAESARDDYRNRLDAAVASAAQLEVGYSEVLAARSVGAGAGGSVGVGVGEGVGVREGVGEGASWADSMFPSVQGSGGANAMLTPSKRVTLFPSTDSSLSPVVDASFTSLTSLTSPYVDGGGRYGGGGDGMVGVLAGRVRTLVEASVEQYERVMELETELGEKEEVVRSLEGDNERLRAELYAAEKKKQPGEQAWRAVRQVLDAMESDRERVRQAHQEAESIQDAMVLLEREMGQAHEHVQTMSRELTGYAAAKARVKALSDDKVALEARVDSLEEALGVAEKSVARVQKLESRVVSLSAAVAREKEAVQARDAAATVVLDALQSTRNLVRAQTREREDDLAKLEDSPVVLLAAAQYLRSSRSGSGGDGNVFLTGVSGEGPAHAESLESVASEVEGWGRRVRSRVVDAHRVLVLIQNVLIDIAPP